MNRISDEQALLIVGSCCAYLNDKFVYEHGLFHGTPPTQTVVRSLVQRMVQSSMSCIRDEPDAHIVIAVMMHALKSMRFSLLHEVGEKLVIETEPAELTGFEGFNNGGTDNMEIQIRANNSNSGSSEFAATIDITDEFSKVKKAITKVLMTLSQNRLNVLLYILEFINKIHTINNTRHGNRSDSGKPSSTSAQSTLDGIISVITPYLYRPYSTSHMSIKHKEQVVRVAYLPNPNQPASPFDTDPPTRQKHTLFL